MPQTIFPEKRTRSQLALPDEIFQVPQDSPMKAAKSALKSQTLANGESSTPRSTGEDTDDELLLSPKKAGDESRKPSSSKRSASPEPHDEYSRASRSPSKGREPKRVKRGGPSENQEAEPSNIDLATTLQQRLTPGHSRHHSDPHTTTARRSGRKRSATTNKKPSSTVSASPSPTIYSPVVSPKKGRAQSVPLFPSTYDIPRIDFLNPPPSPKRASSPTRTPAKEKFRIDFGPFPKSTSLPTIHDEHPTAMDVTEEEATSVDEERELPMVTSEPSIPTSQLEPATSESSTASKFSNTPLVPATPRTHLLNKLIPMSPLTPVPETPFPGRRLHSEDDQIQLNGNGRWGANPLSQFESDKTTSNEPGGATGILPRPPVPTTNPPSKPSQSSVMEPPAAPAASKKPIKGPPAPSAKTAAGPSTTAAAPPKKNAFEMLMKKPMEAKARLAEKGRHIGQFMTKAPQPRPAPPPQQQRHLFGPSKGKEKAIPGIGKAGGGLMEKPKKMKEKMKKKKEKSVVDKPIFVPMEDDEEEQIADTMGTNIGEESIPLASTSKVVDDAQTPTVEDTVMESPVDERAPPPATVEEPPVVQDVLMDEENIALPSANLPSPDVPLPESSRTPPEEPPTTERPMDLGPSVSMDNVVTESSGIVEAAAEEPSVEASADKAVPSTSMNPGPSKLPLVKKRQPAAVVPANRVTRSISKRKDKDPEPSQPVTRKKAVASGSLKRTSSGKAKKSTPPSQPFPLAEPLDPGPDGPDDADQTPLMDTDPVEPDLPPGSPMRTSSPAKTPSKSPAVKRVASVEDQGSEDSIVIRRTPSNNTPTKTKGRSPAKPAPSPSPTKIARATSLWTKPTLTSLSRTFSSDSSGPSSAAGSSLSTLSNALEKLRMPPPSRPNTSMGFSRDVGDEDTMSKLASKNDAALNKTSTEIPKPDGLKRSVTVGSGTARKVVEGSSTKTLVQKPLAMFMTNKSGAGAAARGAGRPGSAGATAKTIFGIGGPPRRTVSKKSSLPMVVGSPVKGGGAAEGDITTQEESEDSIIVGDKSTNDSDIFAAPTNASAGSLVLEDSEDGGKGKAKEKSKTANASRRVSMLSHALSQSLSELPLAAPAPSTNGKGSMGPPATPPSARLKAGSSSNAANSSEDGTSSPSQAGPLGTRASSRIATKNAQVKAIAATEAPISAGSKSTDSGAAITPPKQETLKILNECKIFVDVKTDDGDEAGSLFVEMLEGLGAKVLTRVGQSCTHIVYKNGLMSTLTRYKLLRDPKPVVVGIGWVVDCVEQRKHVEETNFAVDLEGINIGGPQKRRRSVLPKLFADLPVETSEPHEPSEADADADLSMDGSNSSVTLDDELAGLAPLERARRRRSMIVGRP